MLRYRLYDIDLVHEPDLLAAGLAGFITVTYVAIVVGVDSSSAAETNRIVLSVAGARRSLRWPSSRCVGGCGGWRTGWCSAARDAVPRAERIRHPRWVRLKRQPETLVGLAWSAADGSRPRAARAVAAGRFAAVAGGHLAGRAPLRDEFATIEADSAPTDAGSRRAGPRGRPKCGSADAKTAVSGYSEVDVDLVGGWRRPAECCSCEPAAGRGAGSAAGGRGAPRSEPQDDAGRGSRPSSAEQRAPQLTTLREQRLRLAGGRRRRGVRHLKRGAHVRPARDLGPIPHSTPSRGARCRCLPSATRCRWAGRPPAVREGRRAGLLFPSRWRRSVSGDTRPRWRQRCTSLSQAQNVAKYATPTPGLRLAQEAAH